MCDEQRLRLVCAYAQTDQSLCLSLGYSMSVKLLTEHHLVALLNLSPWCHVMVEWLFLAVPCGCLQFVIVVFPDHTY